MCTRRYLVSKSPSLSFYLSSPLHHPSSPSRRAHRRYRSTQWSPRPCSCCCWAPPWPVSSRLHTHTHTHTHFMTPSTAPPPVHPVTGAAHECERRCLIGDTRTCVYEFHLQEYHTMSRACYNCPQNITDCSRQECVPGDGVKRPLLTINRQLPGPSVQVSESLL